MAPHPAVAMPIFGAGVALRAKIVPAPNIVKCWDVRRKIKNFLNHQYERNTIT